MILAQKRKDADQNQHKNNSGSSGEGEVAIAGIPSVVVDEGIPLVSHYHGSDSLYHPPNIV